MPIIAEVRFAHEDGALADTLTAFPDLDVTVVREAATNPQRSVYHLRFEGSEAGAIQSVLDADHTVREASPVRELEEARIWAIEFAEEATLLAPRVTEQDGFVLKARSASHSEDGEPRGWHERWMLPDREAIQSIYQYAHGEGFDFDVLDIQRRGQTDVGVPGPDALTEEQREALVTAYEQGYFAEPRETSLEELAESFDRSASAVGGRINRGLKALIGAALVREDSDWVE